MAELKGRWLSIDENGKYLSVSSDTLYRWIDKHTMPAYRLGRFWKANTDGAGKWVKAGCADYRNKKDLNQ